MIVASEEDARENKIRGSIAIYEFGGDVDMYPTLMSANDEAGLPIPFSALSGLAAAAPYGSDAPESDQLFTVEDSFYKKSRMFTIDTAQSPALIDGAFRIVDTEDVLLTALTTTFNATLSDVFVA